MLNPGTKGTSHWRHTYVQLGKTMDNKFVICENFDYLGARGMRGGFNNQTGPIL